MINQAPFEPFQASNQLIVVEPIYVRHSNSSILTVLLVVIGILMVVKLIRDK